MIPLLPVEEAKRRGKEAGVPDNLAGINVFRAMLQNPPAASRVANFLTTMLFEGKLDQRIRELVILRIGWRLKSEYEFCQHVAVAKRIKMSEQDILGVRDPDACTSYNELDRAVIRMTDELIERAEISPATRAIISRSFTPEQMVELLLAVGNWTMFAIFLKNAEIPLDAGVPSWPEGRAPR
jgi:alkylhydroperoxidase family enzyme